MNNFLKSTEFLDFYHPNFNAVEQIFNSQNNNLELVIDLYNWVRDAFIYDPYHLDITQNGLTASSVFSKKRAWCVEKSILLASLARKFGFPSKLGFAIVKNHLEISKLKDFLKREEIVFHGYCSIFVNDKWVKCTPAFDKRICAWNKVNVLQWDGVHDAMFQEFSEGKKFMEYLHFYGEFDDVPINLMNEEMRKYYPHLFEIEHNSKSFSFKHL
jgi:hypothetical protein